MLFLTETASGYGLFKLKNKSLLAADREDIQKSFAEKAELHKHAELIAFNKFKDTKMAMEESAALIENKMGKQLKKFLKTNIVQKGIEEELSVIDKQLGSVIEESLNINVQMTEQTKELQRALRLNVQDLLEDITAEQTQQMQVSLAHAMSRFKLKFSPDKVDTMIIQAIGLLDDLDKDLNNFAMRLKEWYGWHFPEMSKILTDGLIYAKAVKLMGMRSNCKNTDFSKIGIPEEVEGELKKAAELSYGTDITEEDIQHINVLADRVAELLEYRVQLSNYIKLRMTAMAPNLTMMVGDLVGARLISHAGSLLSLAKQPASTVQVLGAEKALFRAMKTKSNTPKYGLLYHAQLVGKSNPKFKGKISRVLAAKLALSIRVDALGEDTEATVAKSFRDYVERRVAACEEGDDMAASKKHLKKANMQSAVSAIKENGTTGAYNTSADFTNGEAAAKTTGEGEESAKKEKKRKREAAAEEGEDAGEPAMKKKKKKSKANLDVAQPVVEVDA